MKFHKIWVKQCRATRGIKRRYGVKSALDYLIGEKLLNFAEQADGHPEFAAPLIREQLGQSADGMGADAFEDVAQVGKRIGITRDLELGKVGSPDAYPVPGG